MKRFMVVSLALGGLAVAAGSLAALAGGLTGVGLKSASSPAETAVAAQQDMLQTVTLKVDNMFCAACPTIVRYTLQSVEGVATADVFYADKTAVVTFDPAKSSAEQLVAATAGIGYPSTVIE